MLTSRRPSSARFTGKPQDLVKLGIQPGRIEALHWQSATRALVDGKLVEYVSDPRIWEITHFGHVHQ